MTTHDRASDSSAATLRRGAKVIALGSRAPKLDAWLLRTVGDPQAMFAAALVFRELAAPDRQRWRASIVDEAVRLKVDATGLLAAYDAGDGVAQKAERAAARASARAYVVANVTHLHWREANEALHLRITTDESTFALDSKGPARVMLALERRTLTMTDEPSAAREGTPLLVDAALDLAATAVWRSARDGEPQAAGIAVLVSILSADCTDEASPPNASSSPYGVPSP